MKLLNKSAKLLFCLLLMLFIPLWVAADNCRNFYDCFNTVRIAAAAASALAIFGAMVSMGLDFIPGVGTVKGIIEAVTGHDLITGQQLSAFERGLGVVPFLGGLAGVVGITKVLDKAVDASRALDKAVDAGRAIDKGSDIGRGMSKADDAGDIARTFGNEKIPNSKRTSCHDPVDVATGWIFSETIDFDLPGPVPLVWKRIWYSDSAYNGPLGHGWHYSYDMWVKQDEKEGMMTLRHWDGRDIYFEKPKAGEKTFHRKERMEIFFSNEFCVLWSVEMRLYYYFGAVSGSTDLKLIKIQNANEHVINLVYDEQACLVKIIDSATREIKISYHENGLISTVHLPDPKKANLSFVVVSYEYNNDTLDLIKVTDAVNKDNIYEYRNHLMVKRTLRNGINFYFEYDGEGTGAKCIRAWGDNNFLAYSFEYLKEKTLVTDSIGYTKAYSHKNGLVTAIIDGRSAVQTFEYNAFNELIAEENAVKSSTRYYYDERGNTTVVEFADGTSVRTGYENDLPVLAIDQNGIEWKWQYDENGNLIARILPTGSILRYEYEDGLITRFIDAANNSSILTYDEQYNLKHLTRADGNTQTWLYDNIGRYTKYTDARGNTQWIEYDLKNRLIQVNEPDGNERHFTYDGIDNLLSAKDRERDIQFEYVCIDRLSTIHEEGRTTQYRYNTEGILTAIINAKGDELRFTLDGEGSVIAEKRFDGSINTFKRDPVGRIIEVNKPGNRNILYQYDAMGRVSQIQYSDGNESSFSYTKNGLLSEAVNEHISIQMKYDVLGRKITEVQGAHAVDMNYDVLNQRVKLTSDLGANIGFDYNNVGDMRQMEAGDWRAYLEYDAAGLETMRSLPGNITHTWERDMVGRPVSQVIRLGGIEKRRRDYQWQVNNRLEETTDTIWGFSKFEYDKVGNLSGAVYNHTNNLYRVADLVNNYYKQPNLNDRTYGKAGQLLESDTFNYRYDTAGNLIEKVSKDGKQWQYQWYVNGLLKEVKRPDGEVVRFTYDALGRRISKRTTLKQVQWVWDNDVPLHELHTNSSTNDVLTWIFGDDAFTPAARISKEKIYSILADHLGTPVEMYDQNGDRTWSNELDIYGNTRNLEGAASDCPFRYQGQYEDEETGLYYNRFRYYDPESGIYISQDPIGVSGGIELYGYVNDPNAWVDIFGLSHTYWLEKALAAAGRPLQPGQTAHHIVKLFDPGYYAQLAREILARQGLHPDIASNGARLWGTHPSQTKLPNHPGKAAASATGNYHAGRHVHSVPNDKLLHRILSNADKRGIPAERILDDIGRRMETGNWKNSIGCH